MTDSLFVQLPARSRAAGAARDALEPLASSTDPTAFEELRLIASELVTNAIRHGDTTQVRMRVDAHGDRMRIEVEDSGPGFVPAYPPRPHAASGWGLVLVDRLADRWGVALVDGGTCVWAEVGASGERGSAHPSDPST